MRPHQDKLSVSSAARSKFAKESNRERGERTENDIIDSILDSEPNGLTTSELAHKVKKDRETIRRICNNLFNEKKIIKVGKYGSYHITREFLSLDSGLQARLFKRDSINRLFHGSLRKVEGKESNTYGIDGSYYKTPSDEEIGKILLDKQNSKISNERNDLNRNREEREDENRDKLINEYKKLFVNFDDDFSQENSIFNKLLDLIVLTPYLEINKDEKIEQRLIEIRKEVILNFCLKIGILFTFIMIQSLRTSDKGVVKVNITGQEFKVSESWIKDSVDVMEIWRQFQNIIRVLLRTKTINSDGKVKIYDRNKGIYEFLPVDEVIKKELVVTFSEIWPNSFKVLQNCLSDSINSLKGFYDKTPLEFDSYEKNYKEKLEQINEIRKRKEITGQRKKIKEK